MALVPIKGVGVDSMDCCEPMKQPEYAWGTRLCLNDDIVEALKAQGFQVGDVVSVTALAIVTGKDDRLDDSKDRDGQKEVDTSLDLQITELALDKAQTNGDKVKSLYPSMSGMMGDKGMEG